MTALTRCPIDGSRIIRNHDGDIECSVAIIGNHSAAVMLRAYADMHAEAPSSPKGLGVPCKTCGTPRAGVNKAGHAYCEPCHSKGGRTENMPTFHLQGPGPNPYFFDGGRMTR